MSWTTLLIDDHNPIKEEIYGQNFTAHGDILLDDHGSLVNEVFSNNTKSIDAIKKYPIFLNNKDSILTSEDIHGNAMLCLNDTADGGTFLRHVSFGPTGPVGSYVQQVQNKDGVIALLSDIPGATGATGPYYSPFVIQNPNDSNYRVVVKADQPNNKIAIYGINIGQNYPDINLFNTDDGSSNNNVNVRGNLNLLTSGSPQGIYTDGNLFCDMDRNVSCGDLNSNYIKSITGGHTDILTNNSGNSFRILQNSINCSLDFFVDGSGNASINPINNSLPTAYKNLSLGTNTNSTGILHNNLQVLNLNRSDAQITKNGNFILSNDNQLHCSAMNIDATWNDNTTRSIISSGATGSAKTFDLPNKSGTIALTSDIPNVSNFLSVGVPSKCHWGIFGAGYSQISGDGGITVSSVISTGKLQLAFSGISSGIPMVMVTPITNAEDPIANAVTISAVIDSRFLDNNGCILYTTRNNIGYNCGFNIIVYYI